jgi:hypothetical protein
MSIRSSTLLFAVPLLVALTVVPAEAQSPSGANPVLGTWKLKGTSNNTAFPHSGRQLSFRSS